MAKQRFNPRFRGFSVPPTPPSAYRDATEEEIAEFKSRLEELQRMYPEVRLGELAVAAMGPLLAKLEAEETAMVERGATG